MLNKDEQKPPLKLFYTSTGGESWTGGLTYKKNLIYALNSFCPEIKVFLCNERGNQDFIKYKNVKLVETKFKNNLITDYTNKILKHYFYYDFKTTKELTKIEDGSPDVVFTTKFKIGKKIATLYWIPDFQFLRLPEMYSKVQIDSLNKSFRKGISNCDLVVLSSNDAKKDLEKFMPEALPKSRVVSFVAHIPDNLYDKDPIFISKKYNLPEKFIYLPNQFWKHKNHITVFQALKILKDKGIYPFLVLTGNPIDSRNPLYFAELMNEISKWGLREQIAILGFVEHDDVYHLIRQSLCVINPSFFEGWSTTVEEAKSVGKKMILSDIQVHREQNPPMAKYFNPLSPEELAELLNEVWQTTPQGPDKELEEQAKKDILIRMKLFAETFAKVAIEAVTIKKGSNI